MITPSVMLVMSLLTCSLMILVSALMYLSVRERRCLNLLEFWLAYLAYFILSILTEGHSKEIVALCTLGFIWRTRTVVNILSDVAGVSVGRPWFKHLIALGFTLSFILSTFDFGFEVVTFPASLSVFLVGVTALYFCWREVMSKNVTLLHYMLFVNVSLMYLHIMDFPFLRFNHELTGVGFAVVLLLTLFLAVVLPGLTIQDLHEERSRMLEVVLNERSLQLERQSKMSSLGEMTAGLVHELNNPLSLLLTRNGLLMRKMEKGQLDKEALESGLQQMQLTILRMVAITKSLKTFSRDSEKEEKRAVSLSSLVEDTLTFSSDRFLEGNLPLLVNKIPNVTLNCRPVQISQVLLNLLNNAFDAVQALEDKWVRLDFEAHGQQLKIYVTDSGRGIPDAVKEKIMRPFFTTKDCGMGTGLGLSISRQIVKDHGGRLYIEENFLNTTFVVELPCQV